MGQALNKLIAQTESSSEINNIKLKDEYLIKYFIKRFQIAYNNQNDKSKDIANAKTLKEILSIACKRRLISECLPFKIQAFFSPEVTHSMKIIRNLLDKPEFLKLKNLITSDSKCSIPYRMMRYYALNENSQGNSNEYTQEEKYTKYFPLQHYANKNNNHRTYALIEIC